MTITLNLAPEIERRLRERAAKSGQDPAAVAQDLIEAGMQGERTFAEILAPFRRQVAESGMSDVDLDALLDQAREEVWRDRSGR